MPKIKKAKKSPLHSHVSAPIAVMVLLGACAAIILLAKMVTGSQLSTSSDARENRTTRCNFTAPTPTPCKNPLDTCVNGLCRPRDEKSIGGSNPPSQRQRTIRRVVTGSGRRNCTDLFGCGWHESCVNGRCVAK